MNKRVIIAVTNDLSGDQRIHKVAVSLIGLGYEPVLAGRLLPESSVLTRIYKCKRFRIPARKGPLFYILFNIRLFFYLLFSRAGLFLANDLDTLPAVFLAGFIRRKKVVYDSHEYCTEVPELVGRPRVKSVWEFIEKLIFPHLKWVYTVNRSIANIYAVKYGVQVGVIRNVPFAQRPIPVIGVLPQGFTDGPVIMYQGAVNVGRGLEEVIRAMPMMPDCRFLIAGDGDFARWACAPVNLEKVFLEIWPQVLRFPEIEKKYGRSLKIKIYHPENWATIESLDPDVKVRDVLKEFGLPTLRVTRYHRQ